MSKPQINWAVYYSLPPAEAKYQLEHVNDSRVKDVGSSIIACLAIATISVILRFISRSMVKTGFKADDWMIVAALVFASGYATSVLLCVYNYGGGRHAILLKEPVKFAQTAIAAEVFYVPAIASVKISTLLLFARIFPGRRFRIILWSVGIFLVTYSIIQILTCIFQCRPIRGAWDPTVRAKCISENLVFMIMGGMNVLTDIILLCLPMPMVWGLQMQKTMRLQVMGIFCLGGFICIVSVYRIPKLHGLSLVDAPWSDADATIWSVVEVCVAIACACAIVYRPLFNWVFRLPSSAAGSGLSGKGSRPAVGDINQPRSLREGVYENEYKMHGIQNLEQFSVKSDESLSRLRAGEWA